MANEKVEQALERLQRSIELLLSLKIFELTGDRTQSEIIVILDSLGFESGEIIRLLNASGGTVRPILSRARKKAGGKKK